MATALLASRGDAGTDTRVCLPALGDHGKGRGVPTRTPTPRVRSVDGLVAVSCGIRSGHDAARCRPGPPAAQPEVNLRLSDGQPTWPVRLHVRVRRGNRRAQPERHRLGPVSNRQPRALQGAAVPHRWCPCPSPRHASPSGTLWPLAPGGLRQSGARRGSVSSELRLGRWSRNGQLRRQGAVPWCRPSRCRFPPGTPCCGGDGCVSSRLQRGDRGPVGGDGVWLAIGSTRRPTRGRRRPRQRPLESGALGAGSRARSGSVHRRPATPRVELGVPSARGKRQRPGVHRRPSLVVGALLAPRCPTGHVAGRHRAGRRPRVLTEDARRHRRRPRSDLPGHLPVNSAVRPSRFSWHPDRPSTALPGVCVRAAATGHLVGGMD